MDEPVVSVLIASVNGRPMIEECLAALEAQSAPELAEVVVADATDDETRRALGARFPRARILPFPRGTTIPFLRTAAFDASRARIVAVTEDHCVPDARWVAEIAAALADPDGAGATVVGGAVENGSRDRLVDWAVYFCEYARYMAPVPDGPHTDVPGVNVAYRREVLAAHRALLERGFWEGIVHPLLIAEGARIVSSPRLVVSHKKRFGFGYFLDQRFHYSRYYAATRAAPWPAWKRAAAACAMPILPPLLFARATREVARKRRNAGPYVASLPILTAFWISWAVGELAGSLFGAGDSLSRIE